MRLGLIADIHGNLIALDAVLAELDADRVDEIACLGDLAVLGPQPDEVISRIRERGIATVCGNTDGWLIPDHPIPAAPPKSAPAIHLTRWASGRISEANRDFLRGLPLALAIDALALCFHGSPESVDDIMNARAEGVGEFTARILTGGHTHVQELRRIDDLIYVNPGSVGLPGVGPGAPGLPVNHDVAWAEYAVIDDAAGRTEVSLRRIPVDVEQMWAEVQRSRMPHAEWWRSRWAG
jgi:predicted phosphodiesterase